jgi:hypothetical protein
VNASWITGTITFGSQPMADPGNGNFTVTNASGLGTGRGNFTITGTSGTSTSFPDLGAVQTAGGSASAAMVSRSQLGRRDYRAQITRRSTFVVAGVQTLVPVYVPVRVESARLRGVPKGVVRRPPALLVPLPAQTLYVPLVMRRVRVDTVASRPPARSLLPAVTVVQTAVPVSAGVRQHVRTVRILRREPVTIILPAPQTVIVTHPRVVR